VAVVKISVLCDSLLLKKSLEIFLKEHITTYKNAELIISDKKLDVKKPLLVVGTSEESDIVIPFSKSSLLIRLENIYDKKVGRKKNSPKKEEKRELWKLEREIDKLTLKFREDLINTIREYYEK
jgi:hypothetical protein